MLPLLLLKTAQKHPVVCCLPGLHLRRPGCGVAAECGVCPQLVELKNGETYNGHMVQCDSWMNVHLREVICTSKVRAPQLSCRSPCRCVRLHGLSCGLDGRQDGDRFWRIPETYIRGNTIKYLRVPDEVRALAEAAPTMLCIAALQTPAVSSCMLSCGAIWRQVIDKVKEEAYKRDGAPCCHT